MYKIVKKQQKNVADFLKFLRYLIIYTIDKIRYNMIKYCTVRFLQLTGSGYDRMGAKIVCVDRLGNSTIIGRVALFCF